MLLLLDKSELWSDDELFEIIVNVGDCFLSDESGEKNRVEFEFIISTKTTKTLFLYYIKTLNTKTKFELQITKN